MFDHYNCFCENYYYNFNLKDNVAFFLSHVFQAYCLLSLRLQFSDSQN